MTLPLFLKLLAAFVAGSATADALARRRARLDAAVLAFLHRHPGACGLDLIHAKVGRGFLNARLRRLEDEGHLVSEDEPGGAERGYLPRRRYWIASVARFNPPSAVGS